MNLLRNIWVGALLLTSALIPVPCVGLEAPEVTFLTEGFDNGSVYLILQWDVEHDTDHVYFVETSTDGEHWEGLHWARSPGTGFTARSYIPLGVRVEGGPLLPFEPKLLARVRVTYVPE